MLSIVTPVYHEEDNITKVIDGLRAHVKTPYELLIVYDMPEDPTKKVVEAHVKKYKLKNVRLVRSNVGNGRGFMNALKTGFAEAKNDAVLTMMADLCDDPKDIDKMYKLFAKGADVVCASRYMKGGKQIGSPLIKRWGSRVAGLSLYWLRRVPVHDVTNNFKIYRRSMLHKLAISDHGGFEVAMEITVKAHKSGYKLAELPTVWRDREAGVAKFNLRKMAPRYLRWYRYALSKNKPSEEEV